VCDRALVLAGDENGTIVNRDTIQAAWADLQQLPTAWMAPRASTAAPAAAAQVIEFGSLSDVLSESPETPVVDPTELDLDEVDEVVIEPTVEFNSPLTVAPREELTSPARRAPRDPANPFTEEFDEEEVVLDAFAAWDDLFDARTPRVENCRDQNIASLMHTALGEPALAQSGLTLAESGDLDLLVDDDLDFVAGDSSDDEQHESPELDWPRLRLAIVRESAAVDLSPEEAESATIVPVGSTWRDQSLCDESPILIVEDEADTANHAGPPVRRLAYQHLFSRLRSG
jgi:hypothetical protein